MGAARCANRGPGLGEVHRFHDLEEAWAGRQSQQAGRRWAFAKLVDGLATRGGRRRSREIAEGRVGRCGLSSAARKRTPADRLQPCASATVPARVFRDWHRSVQRTSALAKTPEEGSRRRLESNGLLP